MAFARTRRSMVAATLFFLALGAAASVAQAAGGPCLRNGERSAAATRMLQSELMVAALSCRESEAYGRFVHRFEDQLVTHGHRLRTAFRRAHGGAARAQMSRFVTGLANQASARAARQGKAYCAKADALFDKVLAVPPTRLAAFAESRPTADDHGLPACRS